MGKAGEDQSKVVVNTLPESHVLGGPDKLKNRQDNEGNVTPVQKSIVCVGR